MPEGARAGWRGMNEKVVPGVFMMNEIEAGRKVLAILIICGMIGLMSAGIVAADFGHIPTTDVSVYGPGQKAIIAWNGEEEILVISTDIYTSENSTILRVLPLPSNPSEIEIGDFSSFEEVMYLIWEHTPPYLGPAPGVNITFHKKIGAHDITIVEANNVSEFIKWAEDYLAGHGIEKGISGEKLEMVISDYIERGLKFFVFDLTDVSEERESVKPIIYRFESDFLYYPLEISKLASGDVDIDVFAVTKDKIESASISELEIAEYWDGTPVEFRINEEEIEEISPEISALFEGGAWLTALNYSGALEDLEGDLMARLVDEIKFRGTVIEKSPPLIGGAWWNVTVDEVISGPQPCSNELTVYWGAYPPMGYFDPNITVGDTVEVYGNYSEDQNGCSVSLNGKNDYYIISASGVHNLNTGESFATIQAAINDPDTKDEHTIVVDPGIYYENICLNKTLTLIGNGTPTIDAQGGYHAIQIIANDCVVKGFRCTNANAPYSFAAGIVVNSDMNTIRNNICENNLYGIFVYNSFNTVSNNFLTGNEHRGINLLGGSSNTISNNTIHGHDYSYIAIGLYSSPQNYIFLNSFVNHDGTVSVSSYESNSTWNTPSNITYAYKGNTYTNYLGNYWSDYTGEDADGDGIGETPYKDIDNYPLKKLSSNYTMREANAKFRGKVINISHSASLSPIYDVEIGDIIEAPLSKLYLGDDAKVSYPQGTSAEIDSGIEEGDFVEVYGEYYEDSYDISLNLSEHYLKILSIEPPVHNINTGEDFLTIQAAINDPATMHLHTITVDPGAYNENVKLDEPLTIKSSSGDSENTIIIAKNSDDYVFAYEGARWIDLGVTISGLTIKGGMAGIYLGENTNHCNISNNTILNNSYGIYLDDSSNNTLENNNVSNNDHNIYLESSSNNKIINNNASFSKWGIGIWLSDSSNNEIANNTVDSNGWMGISLASSSQNKLVNNKVSNNRESGIDLSQHGGRSNNNTITENNITSNGWGGPMGGINIWESNNNKIYLNNFINNTINVNTYESANIWNSPEEITYTYNSNTYTNYTGNYWDDYTNVDANGDGIWDTPYSIDGDKDYYPLVERFENYVGTTIDQIMADAKLIEKVQTNSTVNLSAIIDDSDFDATLQGDYAVWEEELDDYIYKGETYHGVAGYSKSLLIIKIAVSMDGDFYLGTFNGTANDNLLIFSQKRGVANYYDFQWNWLDQSRYGEPHDVYLDLDARQNYLAFIFAEVYKNHYNKGYIKSGPTDYYELYNCNYSLENHFERPITVIRSFICHQQFDYSWYPEGRRPIEEARNAKWSPIAKNPDQNADLSRSFDVKYQNVSDSFVWIHAFSDNSMHSDTTIYGMDNPPDYSCSGGSGSRTWRVTYDSDAKTYNVHNDNCAFAELFLNDQLPNKVLIEAYTTWSFLYPDITIAVLGDAITSNHTESPSSGDDNNPAPMIWKIEPSKPVKQPPIANFTYTAEGLTVNFTSTSYDPDGYISSYLWNFEDGDTSTEQNSMHVYKMSGEYSVSLTVKDDDGFVSTCSDKVRVASIIEKVEIPSAIAKGLPLSAHVKTEQETNIRVEIESISEEKYGRDVYFSINTSSLEPKEYEIIITAGSESISQKITIYKPDNQELIKELEDLKDTCNKEMLDISQHVGYQSLKSINHYLSLLGIDILGIVEQIEDEADIFCTILGIYDEDMGNEMKETIENFFKPFKTALEDNTRTGVFNFYFEKEYSQIEDRTDEAKKIDVGDMEMAVRYISFGQQAISNTECASVYTAGWSIIKLNPSLHYLYEKNEKARNCKYLGFIVTPWDLADVMWADANAILTIPAYYNIVLDTTQPEDPRVQALPLVYLIVKAIQEYIVWSDNIIDASPAVITAGMHASTAWSSNYINGTHYNVIEAIESEGSQQATCQNGVLSLRKGNVVVITAADGRIVGFEYIKEESLFIAPMDKEVKATVYSTKPQMFLFESTDTNANLEIVMGKREYEVGETGNFSVSLEAEENVTGLLFTFVPLENLTFKEFINDSRTATYNYTFIPNHTGVHLIKSYFVIGGERIADASETFKVGIERAEAATLGVKCERYYDPGIINITLNITNTGDLEISLNVTYQNKTIAIGRLTPNETVSEMVTLNISSPGSYEFPFYLEADEILDGDVASFTIRALDTIFAQPGADKPIYSFGEEAIITSKVYNLTDSLDVPTNITIKMPSGKLIFAINGTTINLTENGTYIIKAKPLWEEGYFTVSGDTMFICEHQSKLTFSYSSENDVLYLNVKTDKGATVEGANVILGGEIKYSDSNGYAEFAISNKSNFPVFIEKFGFDPVMSMINLLYTPTEIFDTGAPANPYPSIAGTHTGKITPNQTIEVQKLYSYSCTGTGGHTEFIRIYGNGINKTASWNGYRDDWHNVTFDSPFTLEANRTYNYTIHTGSYPQIHHNTSLLTKNGWINCTEFKDANGKTYKDWIPAIRLWRE